jgi:hypothetical protein
MLVVGFHSFQGEWVFGFDAAEVANWKPAARMTLQVFNVGSSAGGGFSQRLHRAVAIFATHKLAPLGKGFVKAAG